MCMVWTGKLMTSTDSERRLVLVSPGAVQFTWSDTSSSILPAGSKQVFLMCILWTGMLMTSTDSRLVLVLFADLGAVQFHMVLYILTQFTS
jgi:hypothetical protein